MTPDPRPIPVRFFPASRLGLLVGAAIAVIGAVAVRSSAQTPVAVAEPMDGESLHGPVVINVWLQGCADCMPAFEAWRRVRASHALDDVHVVNVAYGSATHEFAAKYGVNDHLTFDPDGSRIVRQQSIGSFTTLVLDAHDRVILRTRPDEADFVEHVHDAWYQAQRSRN